MDSSLYSDVSFLIDENHFKLTSVNGTYRTKGPLSVGFQITRRCNLRCIYCSEPYDIRKELELNDIEYIISELSSVDNKIVKLTGGEPLVRKDFFSIAELVRKANMFVAVDTNATFITEDVAKQLSETMLYVETTVDGRPDTHNSIRGRFDSVLKGIKNLSKFDVPLLFATVAMGECREDIKYVIKLADGLGVKTVKILTPIPKGRGKNLSSDLYETEYLTKIWDEICEFKDKLNTNLKLILLDWKTIGQGSVILIHPDGLMVGSPSFGEEGCITPLGNILKKSIHDMWNDYPHKINHISKCIEESIFRHGRFKRNNTV